MLVEVIPIESAKHILRLALYDRRERYSRLASRVRVAWPDGGGRLERLRVSGPRFVRKTLEG